MPLYDIPVTGHVTVIADDSDAAENLVFALILGWMGDQGYDVTLTGDKAHIALDVLQATRINEPTLTEIIADTPTSQ